MAALLAWCDPLMPKPGFPCSTVRPGSNIYETAPAWNGTRQILVLIAFGNVFAVSGNESELGDSVSYSF
jgi:hypothetical protein